MEVLYGAKKYLVTPLANKCVTYLERAINPDQVCILLEQSLKFRCDELTAKCLAFTAENTGDVIRNDAFLRVNRDTLSRIVQLEKINATEVELFIKCVDWANAQRYDVKLPLREKLQLILPFIRFPTMTQEEFATEVVPLNILKQDEELNVYRNLSGARNYRDIFSKVSRCEGPQILFIIDDSYAELIANSSARLNVGFNNFHMRFDVDIPVGISGLLFLLPLRGKADLPLNININVSDDYGQLVSMLVAGTMITNYAVQNSPMYPEYNFDFAAPVSNPDPSYRVDAPCVRQAKEIDVVKFSGNATCRVLKVSFTKPMPTLSAAGSVQIQYTIQNQDDVRNPWRCNYENPVSARAILQEPRKKRGITCSFSGQAQPLYAIELCPVKK